MKRGAGDDPFVDDINDEEIEANADDDSEANPDSESRSEFELGGEAGQNAATDWQNVHQSDREDRTEHEEREASTDEDSSRLRSEEKAVAATASATGSTSSSDTELMVEPNTDAGLSTGTNATPDMNRSVASLPYLAKRQLRGLSVKDERNQIPFFLRDEVQRGEKALHRTVEDELGQDVNKTDLREAAYVFAQQHPNGVAEILRNWGIEYLE